VALLIGWPERFDDQPSMIGGIVLLIAGVAMNWPIVGVLFRHRSEGAKDVEAKTPVEAEVTDAKLVPVITHQGTEVYSPRISYKYTFGDETHTRTCQVSTTRHNIMFIHARTLRRYPPGSRIEVYVDPNNPRRSVLAPVSSVSHHVISVVLYAVVLALSGAGIAGALLVLGNLLSS
jgi:hypothetical protein